MFGTQAVGVNLEIDLVTTVDQISIALAQAELLEKKPATVKNWVSFQCPPEQFAYVASP